MSAVIKVGNANAAMFIKPYGNRDQVVLPEQPDPQRAEIERLQAVLVDRDAALADLRDKAEEAREAAFTEGRLAAERERDEERSEALEALREGIEQAQSTLADARDRIDALAILVARAALEKMFGDNAARAAIVGDLIQHQLGIVERQLILQIIVSQLDFPSAEELGDLARRTGLAADQIKAGPDLAAGDCRMLLRLGTLDIGIEQQWGAVSDLIHDLAGLAELES